MVSVMDKNALARFLALVIIFLPGLRSADHAWSTSNACYDFLDHLVHSECRRRPETLLLLSWVQLGPASQM
jgi:hypothetical protein